ncbi:helix-turn-helix domain-containing protein [Tellurirhabdus bombi]|uniref:helix-turn-helix domain-containing protein n=1 Tax=Tellurirhabdus bombi TaxID=2907205 RepID=UPI001F3DB0AE|nr:helix-turn-helix transcriptional regulator [Tellurirhabdus bombi]
MAVHTDHIRLLFGLKLKQLRLDRGLSISELAQASGLSVSYFTEIEKGRKYPKTDKIAAIAAAMGVDYDTLVSLKLSKKLEPISDLLRSKFLTEIPLELFGIDPSDLLELLAEAPAKVSAMISTFMEIGRSYNMSVERIYMSVLRSYQEMHDNYFEDIEAEADRFLEQYASGNTPVDESLLTSLLRSNYNYKIERFDRASRPDLAPLRSFFRPESSTLYLNGHLSEEQRLFILAREVGFRFLNLKNRPLTYAYVEADSWEQILNNYKASYFAGAILIRRTMLIERLQELFNRESWSNDGFLELIQSCRATPERFFYRLSNLLPRYFGIDQLFFYRINNTSGKTSYHLTKEMHLSRHQGPKGIVDEHFCRRWIALTILQELSFTQQHKNFGGALCRAQLSTYADSEQTYFIVSVAQPYQPHQQENMSVSMCFKMTDTLRTKMRFLNPLSPEIPIRIVNETCERCGIFDCRERVAAPIILQRKRQLEAMKLALEGLK